MRKPDLERQKDAEEARIRRNQKWAALDKAVKRLHAEGLGDEEMGRELRCAGSTVARSRERQGLPKNVIKNKRRT